MAVRRLAVRVVLLGVAVAALTCPLAASAAAQKYTFQTIDPPWSMPSPNLQIFMNNSGLIAAQYQDPPAEDWYMNQRVALLEKGRWTIIDPRGARSTLCSNPNSEGEIALGFSTDYVENVGGQWHTKIYKHGRYAPFPDTPGYVIHPISDGPLLGAEPLTIPWPYIGLVGTARSLKPLAYPIAPGLTTCCLQASGVNNAGMMVGRLGEGTWDEQIDGWAWAEGHIFLYDYRADRYTIVDGFPDAWYTNAQDINNQGEIVGTYGTYDEPTNSLIPHLYVLRHGRYTTIPTPPAWGYFDAFSGNDRGQISGTFFDDQGIRHGFVATPMHGGKQ